MDHVLLGLTSTMVMLMLGQVAVASLATFGATSPRTITLPPGCDLDVPLDLSGQCYHHNLGGCLNGAGSPRHPPLSAWAPMGPVRCSPPCFGAPESDAVLSTCILAVAALLETRVSPFLLLGFYEKKDLGGVCQSQGQK